MISEDYNAPSNLPQEVKHTYYPKKEYFDSSLTGDNLAGIDKGINESIKKIKKNSKY